MSAGLWVHSIWVQNNFVCTLQVPFYHRVLVTRSKWNKTCVQSTLGTFKIILFSPIYINDRTLVRIPGLISCIYYWDWRTESRFHKQTAKPWPGRYSNRLLFISIRLKISFFSIFYFSKWSKKWARNIFGWVHASTRTQVALSRPLEMSGKI